jgi:transcriptional regulator with XRE-family HTH domain
MEKFEAARMEQVAEKPEKGTVPSVAIDGSRIRSIRESKKLTQLYVASVVGVTTDTISRWENNRYPSIKRDNAEKLARALEVDVDEIVRPAEAPEPSDVTTPVQQVHRARFWVGAGIVALLVVVIAVYLMRNAPAASPTAIRWTPHFASPGEVIPVEIKVTRKAGETLGFILKEKLPDGVRLVSSRPTSSTTGPADSSIKWLVPGGNSSVTISYTVRIPATALPGSGVKLGGQIVIRENGSNRNEAIGGNDTIRIGAYHWADSNGDGRVDDEEIMPAYYICEDMKGLGLDWKTIEAIWSGKGYRWDPQSGYTVVN